MSAPYLGDFPVNGKVSFLWNTNGQDGASITRSTDGTLKIFKSNATASTWATERNTLNGVTQLEDFDSTGIHSVYIDLSNNDDAGFYAAGNEYQVAITGATIDTKSVNSVIASFSIERSGGALAILKDSTYGLSALETLVDDLESRLGTPSNLGSGATVAANLVDIEAQTDDIGAAGAGLTAIPWNSNWDAEVQSECDDALVARDLDHLVNNGTGVPAVASGSFLDQIMDDGTAVYDRTTDSLQALADSGGGGPTAAQIADAVWDEAISGHLTGGSTGEKLNSAASAGDPWSTALPGSYGAGTAGKIVGDNLNATVSSRAPESGGNIAAIKTKTDYLPSATAGAAGGLMIAGVNAATTFASLTVSGTSTFTGNVSYAAGITITQSTTNGHGISVTGNGTGHGLYSVGGSTGAGGKFQGGATGMMGLHLVGTAGYSGLFAAGNAQGSGIRADGGATGHGMLLIGGFTSGNCLELELGASGYGVHGDVQGNLSGSVGSVTNAVTVGTNNDKTDYTLSSAGIQAIWDALTSALTTIGSIGKRLADYIDAAISGRASAADYTAARATKIDNLDATISSRLASSGYTAPNNAGISSILSESLSHPTLAEIEASTILAKEATVAAVKVKTDTIVWQDITDIKDEGLGKWSINKSTNVLTMYKADGVTILKQFNLTDNASVSERVPV
ncbi:MAG: hypothetical protein IT393_07250 [Nitrospirae bacterium]|nr:hypothetical protein [Nitrospirota bacterium]